MMILLQGFVLLAIVQLGVHADSPIMRGPRSTDNGGATPESNICPQLLRGRDGRDGLPGPSGSAGAPGRDGMIGMRGEKGDPGLRGLPGTAAGGELYTRWGKRTCPTVPGTQLVYAGRVGGSWWEDKGGAANYLCMPDDPDYGAYTPGVQNYNTLYGAEYEVSGSQIGAVHDHNVPCAVCYTSTRSTVMMVPAKNRCPPTWTLEYHGYLMSQASKREWRTRRTMFECVDRHPDSIPGSAANNNGAVFHLVEANCNGMLCPPYDPQKELTCAVCTK